MLSFFFVLYLGGMVLDKHTILKTAGMITIALGMYMVYKGSELERVDYYKDDVIDAEFEIIEDE